MAPLTISGTVSTIFSKRKISGFPSVKISKYFTKKNHFFCSSKVLEDRCWKSKKKFTISDLSLFIYFLMIFFFDDFFFCPKSAHIFFLSDRNPNVARFLFFYFFFWKRKCDFFSPPSIFFLGPIFEKWRYFFVAGEQKKKCLKMSLLNYFFLERTTILIPKTRFFLRAIRSEHDFEKKNPFFSSLTFFRFFFFLESMFWFF